MRTQRPISQFLGLVLAAAGMLGASGCTSAEDDGFPVAVSADGRHLVTPRGTPWFGLGDTAWSLFAELTASEAEVYLDDRASKGFSLVLANLLEAEFATNAPANAFGDAPFVGEPFASAPNERYWAQVDLVVDAAENRGIALLLCPAYLGFEGNSQGWADEVTDASDDDLRRYGRFLGDRYGDRDHVMWLIGHDRVPDATEKARMEAMAEALPPGQLVALSAAAAAGPLGSPPWEPTSINPDLETVYSYADDPADTLAGWAADPRRPVVFLEGRYEQEDDAGLGDPLLRRQLYGPWLSGATAVIFGNNPIWNFEAAPLWPHEGSWQDNLDSPGAKHVEVFGNFVDAQPWSDLEPGAADLIIEGAGTDSESASVRRSGERVLIYVPSARAMVLDLSAMDGSAVAVQRMDPTTGDTADEGVFMTDEPVEIALDQRNAAGDQDWVLIVTAA